MINLLLSSVSVTALLGSGFQSQEWQITVPSGKVSSDLIGFPLRVRMEDLEDFWSELDAVGDVSGEKIRAYDSNGSTPIPVDVTYINKKEKVGSLYVRTDLFSGTDNNIILRLDGASALAPTDPSGRNAVWAGFEVAVVFPEILNRVDGTTPSVGGSDYAVFDWTESERITIDANQGTAFDGTNYYGVDTNKLTKFDSGGSSLTTNSDPVGDVNTAAGVTVLDHCGAPDIIDGELWVPIQKYPASTYDNQYIGRFSLTDLSLIGHFELTGETRESSGVYYDADLGRLYVTDYEDSTSIPYFDKNTGAYQGALTLGTALSNIQGMTKVGDTYYVGQNDKKVYAVATDGTVEGVAFQSFYVGDGEGVFNYNGSIYHTDGDEVRRYDFLTSHLDWARIHGEPLTFTRPTSPSWTLVTSWRPTEGVDQQGVFSAGDADSFDRHSGMYDDSPGFGMWSSDNGWLYTSPQIAPVEATDYRAVFAQSGSTERKILVDGASKGTDTSITQAPSGTDTEYVLAGNAEGYEPGYGYYQYAWVRHEYVSDDWLAADALNFKDPGSFYSTSKAVVALDLLKLGGALTYVVQGGLSGPQAAVHQHTTYVVEN